MRARSGPNLTVRAALRSLLPLIVLAALLPAVAGAQDPGTDAYSGSAPTTAEGTAPPSSEPAPAEEQAVPPAARPVQAAQPTVPSGTVPFTGLQLGLIVAAGAGLLGLGLMLRRSSGSALPGV